MGSNIELTSAEKKCYEAIWQKAQNDKFDRNLPSKKEHCQRKLMSLPLVGTLFSQAFLLTGIYPLNRVQSTAETDSINQFLAEQLAKGLTYDGRIPYEIRREERTNFLKTTDRLAYLVYEKLTDEEKPEINYDDPKYFKERYFKNVGNLVEGVNLDYYSGGEMDGMIQIDYHTTTQDPQADISSLAKIERGGFFTMTRTQKNITNRDYIQSSIIDYEISPEKACLPESTSVVMEELIDIVCRLYLSQPSKGRFIYSSGN